MSLVSKWHIFDGKYDGDLEEHILRLPDCRPFSLNKAYYKRTFTMTKECRQWRGTVVNALCSKNNQLVIESFKKKYDPTKHGIIIAISHMIPTERFFTNEGLISRLSQDITNVEKLLVDIIFDARFSERKEINNLALDDKLIVGMWSEKIFGDHWNITVKLDVVDLRRYKTSPRR